MLNSNFTPLCSVSLPFKSRQKYMHTFDLSNPVMPDGFEDYAEPVRALIEAACAREGVGYMTVDEKIVHAGRSQRRPRPHVDGCFIPSVMSWTHGPGSWNHNCNNIGLERIQRMPVIIASSVPGCRVWAGQFEGEPADDGDLSHIADQLSEGEIVPAHVGYLLSADCVHESMIFDRTVERSFLRIALPATYQH